MRSEIKRLKVQVVNFQGIWSKKDTLASTLDQQNVDIILASETHLSSTISTSEFLPENYTAIRKDNDKDGYGGVAIIHKNDLVVSEVKCGKTLEMVAAKIQCQGRKPVVFCSVYRRPRSGIEYTEELCHQIKDLEKKHSGCALWIGGDFNLLDIDWSRYAVAGHQYST